MSSPLFDVHIDMVHFVSIVSCVVRLVEDSQHNIALTDKKGTKLDSPRRVRQSVPARFGEGRVNGCWQDQNVMDATVESSVSMPIDTAPSEGWSGDVKEGHP